MNEFDDKNATDESGATYENALPNVMRVILFRRLSIVLSIMSVLLLLISLRLYDVKIWFPGAPPTIGEWTQIEVPLDRQTLEMLGSPPADGYRYTNPFGERVESHVISTASYAAYHEPLICMSGYGYEKSALKTMYPFGPGHPVRALVLRNLNTNERILMYYWVQYKDGSTGLQNELALHQAFLPRFAVGFDKALRAEPSCIVRAYIQIHPADRMGLQARRDIDEVCKGLYESLKASGAKS